MAAAGGRGGLDGVDPEFGGDVLQDLGFFGADGHLDFWMGLQRTGGALKSCMTRLQDYQTNKLLLCNVSGFKEAATLSEMAVGTH